MVVTHGMPRPGRGRGAMTIGNFDGVHRGHQAMLSRVVTEARRAGLAAGLLTFEPHPREFFAPAQAPARLSRMRDKLEQFAAAGLDWVHVARFDANFSALTPVQFLDDVLLGGLGMAWLLVGRDFRYGAKRAGSYETLAAVAPGRGFSLEAMPDVQVEGERASSSAVREALARGDFARVEMLLGRPYTVSGRVLRGAQLGRELGFPTANLRLARRPPLAGIYVVETQGGRAQAAGLAPGRGKRRTPSDGECARRTASGSASVRFFRGPLRPAPAGAIPQEVARRGEVRRPRCAACGDRPGCAAGPRLFCEPP